MTTPACKTHEESADGPTSSLHPDRVPIGDVRRPELHLLRPLRKGVVGDDQPKPDHQRDRRDEQPPGPRGGHDCREGGHDHITVATIEHQVVVQLGGRQDRRDGVCARTELLDRQHDGDHHRSRQNQDMQQSGVVPPLFARQIPSQDQQCCRERTEEQVPGEKRDELPGRHQREPTALEKWRNDQHHSRRDQPAL